MIKEKINIAIVDDHNLIRQGLKTILSFEEEFQIIGEAENGKRALEIIKANKPDILLIDVNMPVMNGIDVLRDIKEQGIDIKVIMLTIEDDRKTINEVIDLGADGYMLKDSAGEEIVNAIRTVFKGGKYVDRSLMYLLFSNIREKDKNSSNILDNLSKREVEVLKRISKGFSNKEIGEQLYLTEKTIKNYATNIFKKINVEDRVHATILAIENKIEKYYKAKYED